MGKQLSVILWLIVIQLLFSTGFGDYARTPTGIGSSSGGFNSEEASRDAYAALKSNRFPDSSALRRSDRADVDVDVDSDSIPQFNEPVGLQAEAQDGGVMMLPNFNGERNDENSEVYVEVRRLRFSSGAQDQDVVTYEILSSLLAVSHSEVPGLESGRRRLSLSSDALDVVAHGIWSSLWAVTNTNSEVPDLESGRRRWSTPGASTSSQVARSSNQRLIELGFAILLGSITAVVSIGVGELSSRNRFILNCVLVISVVGFVSLAAAFMNLSSTPSTDTHTNQTANTILAGLGFAASAFGFILAIGMGLPDNLLWVIALALIALVFIFVKTCLDRRPHI
ncbi:uncharacterized protein LOC126702529 isoform X1 [Quercus robur]|uniref:uncharacterized protein LOC126702529 isoform X1 n=1 Tax=Quercus robur TaxID=38942 RepID=UPI002162714D|nr:uncharacterized protein LOC126702529 isoform X1 [Quercus robur]